jgi:hypothetical protein
VILWAWGGLIVALLLTRFLSQKAELEPAVSALTLLGSVFILLVLTIITWLWLGRKDDPPEHR